MSDILMRCEGLTVEFPAKNRKKVHAVSGVSLDIQKGETLALVGESGCGKSTLGRALIGLIKPTSGKVYFDGKCTSDMREREFSQYRRRMQLIFQDPYASLDPRMSVREIIAEPLRTYRELPTQSAMDKRIAELLHCVGMPEDSLFRYPHQFSGGQRQRIGIARAIALSPELVVCDEPVSALDVSVQNQILNLLRSLQKSQGLTYFFISHDLSVVRFMASRVCVMFLGKLCEVGNTEEVYTHPLHPYTRFLLSAVPKADPNARNAERLLLEGELPSPIEPPSGCRFRTRCPYATDSCAASEPKLCDIGGRKVACHRAEELCR